MQPLCQFPRCRQPASLIYVWRLAQLVERVTVRSGVADTGSGRRFDSSTAYGSLRSDDQRKAK